MRKSVSTVQEISNGFSAAEDRGYNKLQIRIREFTVDEANDLQEILTDAHRAGRLKPAGDRRAVEGTSCQHVCAFAARKCACAADRRFTQPGHYLLECVGKRRAPRLWSVEGAGPATRRDQVDANRFRASSQRRPRAWVCHIVAEAQRGGS